MRASGLAEAQLTHCSSSLLMMYLNDVSKDLGLKLVQQGCAPDNFG